MEILSYVAPAEYLIKTLGFPATETWRHGIGCAGFVIYIYFLFVLGWEALEVKISYVGPGGKPMG